MSENGQNGGDEPEAEEPQTEPEAPEGTYKPYSEPETEHSYGIVDQSGHAFDEVRRLIEHEDGLVDKRIGWMLAFNGFLFAAYGLSLGAEISLAELAQKEPEGAFCVAGSCVESVEALTRRIETLRASLVIAGCLSALAALAGVWAAMRAMAYVRNDYGLYLRAREDLGSVVPAFPSVKTAAFLGNAYGLLMPCLVSVPWLYVWSKGYAGTLPGAAFMDRYWVVVGAPLIVLVVAAFCLGLSIYEKNDPHARHKK